jgi:hypothetical protein
MADEAQVIYEYTNGNTVEFKTDDLSITYHRHGMKISKRPDGKMYVDDPGIEYRKFTFSAVIPGADANEMNTVQMAAITYSGGYPRIQKIYLTGATTLTNIEVAIPDGGYTANDLGNGWWQVHCIMEEKTD